MKRNWYAILILALLGLELTGGGLYVIESTETMERGINAAFAYTAQGDYPNARYAYEEVTSEARQRFPYLCLLLRRNLVDQLGQTLATLPEYANPDNLADLAVESERAKAQIQQLRKSYLCVP